MKKQFYFLSILLVSVFFSVSSTAQSGNALSLDGTNAYMSVTDHSDLDIAPGQAKTITCWIKTTSTATSRIIAKRSSLSTQNPGTAGTTGTGYEMWMGNGANAGKMAGNAAAWNTISNSAQSFSTAGYNPVASNSGTRKDVSVFISYDEGATWNTSKSIYPQASAYSSLTILPDGTIGMYYENCKYGDIYDMYFTRFNLDWLTNGADTYFGMLPLNLINFQGKLSANKLQTLLKWQTVNEVNSNHFDVEYSVDRRIFSKVGEVAAANKPTTNDYAFTHNIPAQSATIYYRLKMIDKDGKFTYSNVLRFNKTDAKFLLVSPNPVTNTASVSASFTGEATVTIISAANGQTIKTFNTTQNAFTIDMAALPKQLYLLKLKTATSEDCIKILKQ